MVKKRQRPALRSAPNPALSSGLVLPGHRHLHRGHALSARLHKPLKTRQEALCTLALGHSKRELPPLAKARPSAVGPGWSRAGRVQDC